jgi:hypothetical protein
LDRLAALAAALLSGDGNTQRTLLLAKQGAAGSRIDVRIVILCRAQKSTTPHFSMLSNHLL